VWELYTGQPAFNKLHVGQFFEAVVVRNLRPKIPCGMAADYQLLMQSCWSADPSDRYAVLCLAALPVATALLKEGGQPCAALLCWAPVAMLVMWTSCCMSTWSAAFEQTVCSRADLPACVCASYHSTVNTILLQALL
jgi:hypothetical protein